MKLIVTLSKLYLPVVLLILILFMSFSKKQIDIDIFSLFKFPISIKGTIVGLQIKWVVFALYLLGTFFYYLTLDFSAFFPHQMEMTVHFNEKKGITDLINKMKLNEVNGLDVVNDSLEINNFFQTSDSIIKQYLSYNDFYTTAVVDKKDVLEIVGNATFSVKKMAGIQSYQIVSSHGELRHKKIIKGKDEEKLITKFEKIVSPNDKIVIRNPRQILEKIIISPSFSQSLIINGKGEEKLQEILIGVTMITSFLVPAFSNTLYLYRKEDKLIPIGYAVYCQKE